MKTKLISLVIGILAGIVLSVFGVIAWVLYDFFTQGNILG